MYRFCGNTRKTERAEAEEQDKWHEKARLRSKDTSRRREKQSQVSCIIARDGCVIVTPTGGRTHG